MLVNIWYLYVDENLSVCNKRGGRIEQHEDIYIYIDIYVYMF